MRKYRLPLKNLLCEIRNTWTRFLSIFAICALGAAFFAGIRATSPDMREAGDALFLQNHMSDITVMCSKGVTKDDIKALREMPGVAAVAPEMYVDAMMTYAGQEFNLRLRSLPIAETQEKTGSLWDQKASYAIDGEPDYSMNLLELRGGRLPLDDGEVALDDLLQADAGVALGDRVTFASNSHSVTLRVVGFVYSSKYVGVYERGNSTIGNGNSDGFAYTSGNAIQSLGSRLPLMGMLTPTYTQAEVLLQNPQGYSSFSQEYEDMVAAAMDCIEAYGDAREGTWYVEDRAANPGYSDYKSNTERIAAVGEVFPLIFFVVAALVSLTTMTRMVEEQRIEMGTFKALGYGEGVITAKYFAYAMLACLSGSIVGCLIGFWLFPTVILSAYGIMYRIPNIRTPFRGDIALLAVLASAACTGVATLAASAAALREVPATLMRPKAPKAGKRVFLEYVTPAWNRLGFTAKVTVRNLLRYKKRFFMSVIGIAGSCALLVTGFGLNDSIFGITDKQFNGVWNMDLQAYTYDGMARAELQEIVEQSAEAGRIQSTVYCSDSACDAKQAGKRIAGVHVLGVDGPDALAGKINLIDKGRICALRDDGAVITRKLAETFSLGAGDAFDVIKDGAEYTVRVTDVVDNYVRHYVYMTDTYYEEVFGSAMEYGACLINLQDGLTEAEVDGVVAALLQDPRMYTIRTLSSILEDMENVLSILDYIVMVLIGGAALLTFVVMLNLTNINIGERKRELATLRVLGFYDREMYDYVFRENNALAVIGAAAGLVLGRYMHAFVIKTCEVDLVMFVRRADAKSFLYAFALTVVFSLFVNLMMRRKVRAVDMVTSLKSAE